MTLSMLDWFMQVLAVVAFTAFVLWTWTSPDANTEEEVR